MNLGSDLSGEWILRLNFKLSICRRPLVRGPMMWRSATVIQVPHLISLHRLILISALPCIHIETIVRRIAHSWVFLLTVTILFSIGEIAHFFVGLAFSLSCISLVFKRTNFAPVDELHVIEIRFIRMHCVIQQQIFQRIWFYVHKVGPVLWNDQLRFNWTLLDWNCFQGWRLCDPWLACGPRMRVSRTWSVGYGFCWYWLCL